MRVLILALLVSLAFSASFLDEITNERIAAHLNFIGDVALEGRAPGTRGLASVSRFRQLSRFSSNLYD
jgi:hypothetical protein